LEALGDRIASVAWGALAVGLVFSLANIALRSQGWRNVLRAAYPQSDIAWRSVFGAAYAGVGVNAVLPARLGDAVKLVLVRSRIRDSSYPTLASTFVVESIVDTLVGGAILLWAWQAGALPGTPQLTSLPLFEIGWYARNPWILGVLALAAVVAILVLQSRLRRFWDRVRQGVVILATPTVYLRHVALYQLLGWGCRVGGAFFYLEAFHVEASLENALLVQVASTLSTLVPATPGGLGPRQALLIVLLAGAASPGTVLAFGVGMELALTAWNVAIGFSALTLMVRGTGVRSLLRGARASARGEQSGSVEGG
ncbi:MAG: lysylphosphatidylglycerol synthase transmembrane domain-containing protein, partial [Gaiellaceae bacterium]